MRFYVSAILGKLFPHPSRITPIDANRVDRGDA
jgi:hypothetical protein